MDVFVERGLVVGVIEDEELGQFFFVQFSSNPRECEEPFGHGGEGKEVGGLMVEDRFFPGLVASEEEALFGLVPNREDEGSHEVFDAVATPFLVGGEDEFAVGEQGVLRWFKAQLGYQIFPVVETEVACEGEGTATEGLPFVGVLWSDFSEIGRESASVTVPRAGGVGTVDTQSLGHVY